MQAQPPLLLFLLLSGQLDVPPQSEPLKPVEQVQVLEFAPLSTQEAPLSLLLHALLAQSSMSEHDVEPMLDWLPAEQLTHLGLAAAAAFLVYVFAAHLEQTVLAAAVPAVKVKKPGEQTAMTEHASEAREDADTLALNLPARHVVQAACLRVVPTAEVNWPTPHTVCDLQLRLSSAAETVADADAAFLKVPVLQSRQTGFFVPSPATAVYLPAAHATSAMQSALSVAAETVLDVDAAVLYVLAGHAMQTGFAAAEPTVDVYWPAAHGVCTAQVSAVVAEADAAALNLPLGQASHVASAVVVPAIFVYLPAPQSASLAHESVDVV